MIYLKSAMAGLLAAAIAAVVLPIFAIVGIGLYSAIKTPPGGAVGWDPISLIHPPLPIVALIVVSFASVFFWELRRLTHR
jgi:hypothetical protein